MAKEAQNWTLYVLKLEKGKWFVDITTGDPKIQLKQHQNGAGPLWTQRYTPVDVSYVKEFGDISEEEALKYAGRYLRKYMEHYGDSNVRGGDLPDDEPKSKTKGKAKPEAKKRFPLSLWNTKVLSIVIIILVLVIAYLLLERYVLAPSTATYITQ